MTEKLVIQAQTREKLGKRGAKFYRSRGQVLAVMYDTKSRNQAVTIPEKTAKHVMSFPDCFNRVLSMELGKEKHLVILHAVDRHVVDNQILHLDFLRVKENEYVTIRVPIVVQNKEKCVGIKMGGVLNVVMRDIELECLAVQIPHVIECDVSSCDIGDSIHVRDLKLPSDVKLVHSADDTVLSITLPQSEKADIDTEVESAEETDSDSK